ncbi:MAG: hypothetical protein ACOYMA_00455 [Bacteroidia bacterium]
MNQKTRVKALKSIHKQAEFSVMNLLVDSVKNTIKPDDLLGSVGQLFTEGLLYTALGPAYGIIATLLDTVFGVNIGTLLGALKKYVLPYLISGFNHSDITGATVSLTGNVMQTLGISQSSSKANTTLGDLAESEGLSAQGNLYSKDNRIIKEASFRSLFASLSLKTLVSSIIKSILIGFGLSAAAGAVKYTGRELLGIGGGSTGGTGTGEAGEGTDGIATPGASGKTILQYMGPVNQAYSAATIVYKNNASIDEAGGSAFYITLSGSFEDTIISYIKNIYADASDAVYDVIENNIGKVLPSIEKFFIRWNNNNIEYNSMIRVPPVIENVQLKSIKNIADLVLSRIKVK